MQWREQQLLFKQRIQQGDRAAEQILLASTNTSIAQGLQEYADGYRIRLQEFLLDDFPITAARLGADFSAICRGYADQFPSRSCSGTDFGRYLPFYLGEKKWPAEQAFIPALAQFEWLLQETLYFPERARTGLEKMTTAREEEWPEARFLFSPSLRIFDFSYPVDLHYEGESAVAPEPCSLMLWREGEEANYCRVSEEERQFLDTLRWGTKLGELTAAPPSPNLLGEWILDGIIYGIEW